MSTQDAETLYERLKREAEAAGYLLNPDKEFVLGLMEGLLTNEERYGYQSCPCRLAEGIREKDLDIICPCELPRPRSRRVRGLLLRSIRLRGDCPGGEGSGACA